MASQSRERMVQSAAALMRERGLAGTSFREVLEHSGAPRGSIYHHFPEGKNQLAEEAVRAARDRVAAFITDRDGDPVTMLRTFVALWREGLESSDYRAGCVVMAVATEAPRDEPQLTAAAAAAFTDWITALTGVLHEHGVAEDRAGRVATLIVAAVEGAVVLCRAQHRSQPLLDVGAELELLLQDVG